MSFESKNLNYIYNVEYYKGVDFTKVKSAKLSNADLTKVVCTVPARIPEGVYTHSISLKTSYPGLLAGVGMLHQIGAENEFSLGFNFDYVTGVPYIPGSTVKGVLRSAFENESLIQALLDNTDVDVNALKIQIFEGEENGDVFFDAFPEKSGSSYMAEDFITPHGNDLTKNPTPIMFVKVKPDVVFKFCFRLKDYSDEKTTVTAAQKQKLFEDIIKLLGMGAKTNVGYGEMVDVGKKTNDTGKKCKTCGKPISGQFYYCTDCYNAYKSKNNRQTV